MLELIKLLWHRIKRLFKVADVLIGKSRFSRAVSSCKVILLGTPSHTNIGDSAIVLAELNFLKRCGIPENEMMEITTEECNRYESIILCCKPKLICWHGGGNMGDQWIEQETLRRKYLSQITDIPVVLFPQTVYYSDTQGGREEKLRSMQYYGGRPDFWMFAREVISYEAMHSIYPTAKVELAPDIVLSTTAEEYGITPAERFGALLVARKDPERKVPVSLWEDLCKYIACIGLEIYKTDMYSEQYFEKEDRYEYVSRKMQEFCKARLVITDRLHGMIFAALTATPCVVFSNYNQKVKGTYDLISYLPYIRFVETIEEAKTAIDELILMKSCVYDNSPIIPYYKKLVEVVMEYAKD